MEVSKADWKLFRDRLPEWQEKYMEKLNLKYAKLLAGGEPASEKFWKLHDQIKRDARKPGVILELEKQEAAWDLARLIKDRAIKKSDLEGFSPEMIETVEMLLQRN